ncbi:TM0106 family RecB-like putative nuclease [Sanguibacter sp. 25GB23B1]|uniref:TM0106 family RecB-like putative nuclease n=1 Tax=unclassified Sanguibacter TaxID=2645534 RepID=UPI0032AFA43A
MLVLDDVLVCSATDIALSATCELALLSALDLRLGRTTSRGAVAGDAMLKRTAQLGLAHEKRVLQDYLERFGPHDPASGSLHPDRGVAVLGAERWDTADDLRAAHERTVALLRSGVDVVYQGTVFDGRFLGRPDFLVREDDAGSGPRTSSTHVSYAVVDTKLARHAKVTALLQVAAYADQLAAAGIEVAPQVRLVLGDGSSSSHAVADIVPVYRERRARLEAILDEHHGEDGPVRWGDERYLACGRCDVCAVHVTEHRDVLLVAGMRTTQRARLAAAGIRSIDELATSTGPVPGIAERTLTALREQAAMQVAQELRPPLANGQPDVHAVVVATDALAALPPADPGDLFFDFEGDPLWAERGSGDWGLEYLFGVVETGDGGVGAEPETFRPFWAHSRAEEKQALADFLDYVTARRAEHPAMHVYHYAPYEKTALGRLVGRHGVGEAQLDELLRAGVLVDLYATVRQSIRVSQPSYSIKKLEPLYMGDDLRSDALDNAADSIAQYALACELRDAGRTAEHEAALDLIAGYNRYDCVSTLRLRDWLLERAAEAGVTPTAAPAVLAEAGPSGSADDENREEAIAAEALELLHAAGDAPRDERTHDEQGLAMLSAALGYHRRENKPFWWEHFDRLTVPPDEWAQTRDVLVAETVSVTRDWFKEGNQRSLRREITLVGELATGSTLGAGSSVWCIYSAPLPPGLVAPQGAVRQVTGTATVLRVTSDAAGHDVLVVEEVLKKGLEPYDELPMAVGPGSPVRTTPLENAIREVASSVRRSIYLPGHSFPAQAGLDILRRLPPQLRDGGAPGSTGAGVLPVPRTGKGAYISAIADAVRALDRSYVAVQGPPGTGKTFVGARVIERLVRSGWHVGVVAPSHAVVENLLDTVVEAGVPGYRVGKTPQDPSVERTWTAIPEKKQAKFLAEHRDHGYVVGGTAWDFTNTAKVGRGELDLLVVDEAGQFSLANTLAVSVAAQNLLLLGDPQQLPQVTQGTHPEPVDQSALSWVAEGHDALPADRGYFLERTWRMHPALCAPVSRLAYEGRLVSEEATTTARDLEGVEPGVRTVLVEHRGNAVLSTEEADEVVRQVAALVGTPWSDGTPAPDSDGEPDAGAGTSAGTEAGTAPDAGRVYRPLADTDILVVAAYNAQRALVERSLRSAGFGGTRVGTVDKFQGQQAPVVIMTMAASSADDVPRGMGFLLSRNRVNVAVSRGQWLAVVVRSPWLTDYLPATPEGLCELGAFIGLGTARD